MLLRVRNSSISLSQCRLIISQMSSTRCELINGFSVIFLLVALSTLLLPFMARMELVALRLLALTLTIAHVHYAVSVVQQMCDHFKINCLSLGKREIECSKEHLLREFTDTGSKSSAQNINALGLADTNHSDSVIRSVDDEQLIG